MSGKASMNESGLTSRPEGRAPANASEMVRNALNQAIYDEGEEAVMAAGDRAYATEPSAGQASGEGLTQRDIVAALKHLQQRLAAGEKRNTETARLLSERLENLRDRLGAVDPDDIDRRISALENSGGKADKAFAAMRGVENAVGQIATQFEATRKEDVARLAETEERVEVLARTVERSTEETRSAVDAVRRAVESLAETVDQQGSVEGLDDAVRAAAQASEERIEALADEIARRLEAIERRLDDDIEQRLASVEAADNLFDEKNDLDAGEEEEPVAFGRRVEDVAAAKPQKPTIDEIFDSVDLGSEEEAPKSAPAAKRSEEVERAAGADRAALRGLVAKSRGADPLDSQLAEFEAERLAEGDRPRDFLSQARAAAKHREGDDKVARKTPKIARATPPGEDDRPKKKKPRSPAALDELDELDGDATVALTEADEEGSGKRMLVIALLLGVLLVSVVGMLWVRSIGADDKSVGVPAQRAPVEQAAPAPQPAAPRDNGLSAYEQAMTVLTEGADPARAAMAFDRLGEAADRGYPPAQFELGKMYERGLGVETDLVAARGWYRQAAEAGNRDAMHVLGVMYARGRGGARDETQAVAWFQRAAELGLVNSQFNLGAIFQPSPEKGPGDLQDAEQSYFWYALAASNGDALAMPQAVRVGETLEDAERAEVDARVESWEARSLDPAANDLNRLQNGG